MNKLEEEKRMFLAIIDGFYFFYCDNVCYKCDIDFNIIQTTDIDFPFNLKSDEL